MTIFFLPGAGASASFWQPVADQLPAREVRHFFAWSGLGNEPPDASIRAIDDLVRIVLAALEAEAEPAVLVAQSMGGYVAMKAALAVPGRVRRIVLAVTSAGVPMSELGGSDWRASYQASFPDAASWIGDPTEDLSVQLADVAVPCLLVWGDADPISPVAVGERLAEILPDARLHVLAGANHDLAITHAAEVAGLIREHLG